MHLLGAAALFEDALIARVVVGEEATASALGHELKPARVLRGADPLGCLHCRWSALKSKFECGYKDISPEQFTEAVSLVARVVLEGEWLPKQKEGDFVISQRDALDICHLLHHAEWCVHRWNQDISKGVMALNQPLWSRTHEHFQEVERVGRGLERSMSEMIGHFRGRLGGLRPGESAGRSLTM